MRVLEYRLTLVKNCYSLIAEIPPDLYDENYWAATIDLAYLARPTKKLKLSASRESWDKLFSHIDTLDIPSLDEGDPLAIDVLQHYREILRGERKDLVLNSIKVYYDAIEFEYIDRKSSDSTRLIAKYPHGVALDIKGPRTKAGYIPEYHIEFLSDDGPIAYIDELCGDTHRHITLRAESSKLYGQVGSWSSYWDKRALKVFADVVEFTDE